MPLLSLGGGAHAGSAPLQIRPWLVSCHAVLSMPDKSHIFMCEGRNAISVAANNNYA